MPVYRKKPVTIEAIQWDGSSWHADHEVLPWIHENGCAAEFRGLDGIAIATLEGVMTASPRDFIIRGVQGEFYPCKPDIFDATYEEV